MKTAITYDKNHFNPTLEIMITIPEMIRLFSEMMQTRMETSLPSDIHEVKVDICEFDPIWVEANAQVLGFRLSEDDQYAEIFGVKVTRDLIDNWDRHLIESKNVQDPTRFLNQTLLRYKFSLFNRAEPKRFFIKEPGLKEESECFSN